MNNYALRNLLDEYKVDNFRAVVLYELKETKLFSHLDGVSFGSLSLTDVSDWLINKSDIQAKIAATQVHLDEVLNTLRNPQSYLEKEWKGVEADVAAKKNLAVSSCSQYAQRISECAAKYKKYLSLLSKNARSASAFSEVQDQLTFAYNTAIKEAEDYEKEGAEALEIAHKAALPDFSQWKAHRIKDLSRLAQVYASELLSLKASADAVDENNEQIRQIFATLAQADKAFLKKARRK